MMQLTKLKFGVVLTIGWGVIAILDGYFRLYVAGQDVDVNDVEFKSHSSQAKLLSAEHANLILQKYAKYAKEEVEVVETENSQLPGMSRDEQALQQGRLDKLFIGDDMYQLTGIFGEPEYFAVLMKTNVRTGASEEIKLVHDKQLGDYMITQLEKGHVQFSLEERHIQLVMFN
jgi:hypothetical protein